jgi:hypothetical protein
MHVFIAPAMGDGHQRANADDRLSSQQELHAMTNTIAHTRKLADLDTRDPRLSIAQVAIRRHIAQTCHIYRLPGESVADCYERLHAAPTIKNDMRDEAIIEAIARGVPHDVIAFATHSTLKHVRMLAKHFDEVESA